jgi:hypothetical protein
MGEEGLEVTQTQKSNYTYSFFLSFFLCELRKKEREEEKKGTKVTKKRKTS